MHIIGMNNLCHSDREGKGTRPQVGEHCVKDTKEEEVRMATDAFSRKNTTMNILGQWK